MLARVKELNGNLFEFKKQCWDIEAALLALEKKLADIEKDQAEKFKFPAIKEPLDFKTHKIKELFNRIEFLEKEKIAKHEALLKQLRAELSQRKERYDVLQKDIDKAVDAIDKYNKDILCKNLSALNKELNSLAPKERLEIIGNLDGAVSLLAVMQLITQIQEVNNKYFISKLAAATNIKESSFRGQFKEGEAHVPSFEGLFFKATNGKSFNSSFEEFTKKTTQEITQASLDAVSERIFADFWGAATSKWNLPIKDNSAYNEMRACVRTSLYLTFFKETFRFTNEIQSTSTLGGVVSFAIGGEIGQFLKMSLDQVRNPYRTIPLLAGKISVPKPALPPKADPQTIQNATNEINLLFFQLALWIKGLHDRCYSQIPPFFKTSNGVIKEDALQYRGDKDDRKFADNKNNDKTGEFLVKWSLAQFHLPHFEALLKVLPKEILQSLQEAIPGLKEQFPTLFAEASVAPTRAPTEVKSQVPTPAAASPNPNPVSTIEQKVFSSSPTVPTLFAPPAQPEVHALQQETVNISGEEVKPPLYKEKLAELKKEVGSARLSSLKTYLAFHELNKAQIFALETRKTIWLNIAKGYTGAWFKKSGMPNLLGRKHETAVGNTRNEVNNALNITEALNSLLQLGLDLKGKGSRDIGPAIDQEIDEVITTLFDNAVPEPKQTPVIRKCS